MSRPTTRICDHPLHGRWRAMVRRCTEPNHHAWPRYGGRGICVFHEWVPKGKGDGRRAFLSYVKHVESLPGFAVESKTEVDRIDNDGDYKPGNLRWVTPSVNQRNRSDNAKVRGMCGREWNVPEIVAESGLDRGTVHQRIKRGWSLQRILTTPKRKLRPRKTQEDRA